MSERKYSLEYGLHCGSILYVVYFNQILSREVQRLTVEEISKNGMLNNTIILL